LQSHVKTHSPMFYAHTTLNAGARQPLPTNYSERAAYVVSGAVEYEQRTFQAGQMLVFARRDAILTALTPAVVMLLGGEPLGARYLEWNFVASARERIEQAKADWRAGRMKLPDLDNQEFIPLPSPPASPNPMS
jgi:redox-sensitive bicupin YhaK (pirin superfamily)